MFGYIDTDRGKLVIYKDIRTNNTSVKDLADMFSIYRDYTPLTKEEEKQEERIKKRVELMLHSEELYEQVHTGKITLEEAYTQYKASDRARVRKNSDL